MLLVWNNWGVFIMRLRMIGQSFKFVAIGKTIETWPLFWPPPEHKHMDLMYFLIQMRKRKTPKYGSFSNFLRWYRHFFFALQTPSYPTCHWFESNRRYHQKAREIGLFSCLAFAQEGSFLRSFRVLTTFWLHTNLQSACSRLLCLLFCMLFSRQQNKKLTGYESNQFFVLLSWKKYTE